MSAVTDELQSIASSLWIRRQSQYTSLRIVCAGNSLTAGQGGTPYPTQLAALRPSDVVVNVGVASRTTPTVDAQALTEVDPYGAAVGKKNICVFWEVRNHMYSSSATPAQAISALETACLARRKRGFKVIVCDTMPTSSYGTGTWTSANRVIVNGLISDGYASFADALVKLSDVAGLQDASSTTYFVDGVHCTTAGYALVAAAVNDAVLLV